MAKSWQYPRWRRIVMQLVLWLVLAGTLGLAALVDHKRSQTHRPSLGNAASYGDLEIRLPKRWQVAQGTDDHPLLVVQATEGGTDSGDDDAGGGANEASAIFGGARVIAIYRQHTGTLISPTEYLAQAGGSLGLFGSAGGPGTHGVMLRTSQQKIDQTPVAGQVGALLSRVRAIQVAPGDEDDDGAGGARGFRLKEILACTVLPSHEAITVMLSGTGVADPADEALVREIAATLTVKDQPSDASASASASASAGSIVEIHGGTHVALPDGFRDVSTNDPNAIDRQLLCDKSLVEWTALDLVPCAFFPDDGPNAILAMLSTRDAHWRMAEVTSDAPGSYKIDSRTDDPQFPSRAYLIADKSGHALLGIFRGGGRGDHLFDPVWQAIVKGLVFPQTNDLAPMLTAGAEEAKRLSATGLEQLLGAAREDEWWLWYRETPEHYVGWTSLRHDHPSRWGGARETRWRTNSRALVRIVQTWETNAELSTYGAKVLRGEASPAQNQAFVNVFEQTVTLRRGQVSIKSIAAAGSSLKLSPGVANGSSAMPPQFVPGGVLPQLLGKLSPDKSMILRTESFVGFEGDAGPGLLTLLIRPAADDGPTHKAAGDDDRPMRCVTVEVNGTGEISRWYFRPPPTTAPTTTATAESTDAAAVTDAMPEAADFADHLHGVRSDLQQIRLGFSGDGRMVP
jgi:hypothetical protein